MTPSFPVPKSSWGGGGDREGQLCAKVRDQGSKPEGTERSPLDTPYLCSQLCLCYFLFALNKHLASTPEGFCLLSFSNKCLNIREGGESEREGEREKGEMLQRERESCCKEAETKRHYRTKDTEMGHARIELSLRARRGQKLTNQWQRKHQQEGYSLGLSPGGAVQTWGCR